LHEKTHQFLYLNKKSGKMEPVGGRVMDIHCDRHDVFAAIQFIPAPGYHRRKKFAFVKDVDVKMPAFHPRKAGDVEKVRRLVFNKGLTVLMEFLILWPRLGVLIIPQQSTNFKAWV